MTYTNAEKAAEAERELKMRADVYKRRSGGKLTPMDQRRMALMEEIANDYRTLDDKDKLI